MIEKLDGYELGNRLLVSLYGFVIHWNVLNAELINERVSSKVTDFVGLKFTLWWWGDKGIRCQLGNDCVLLMGKMH